MTWLGSGWFGAVASLLTGGLFLVSLDVGPVGPLALIAPIPLLVYALSAPRAWSVGLAALVARALGMAGLVYVYDVLPMVALLAWIAVTALMFAVVVLLTRWINTRLPAAAVVFSYPLLLVSVEGLFGGVSPHGSFGAMGYSLVDVLPLLQVASLGGLAALTFCVALVPMALALLVVRPADRRATVIAAALPLFAALAFGAMRLGQDYESQARVALVGVDAQEGLAYRGEAQAAAAAQEFAAQVAKVARQHPDYIVLPEKQLGGARAAGSATALLAAAVSDTNATLVVGFDELLPEGARVNSAQILKSGQPLQRYVKRRLIPGLELGYTPGPGSFVEDGRGVAICKDMDFPAMIRDYGQRGVELLLVPAWDFVKDGKLHSRMALVRGVENGFAIARAAAAGRLTASDRYGRVLAEAITSYDKPVSVVTELGLRSGGTWYTRLGDAFQWLCIAAMVLLLGWRMLRR